MNKLFTGKLLASLMIGALAATFAFDADAQRRLGGGRNLGKQSAPVQQRQATPPPQQQTPQAGPQQQTPAAAAAQRPGAAPAAAARSPWRGALMGLAAGLGIAALASYLGLSEALTMFLTALLIGLAVMLLIGFIVRRMRGGTPQPAYGTSAGTRAGTNAPPGTYKHVGYESAPPQPASSYTPTPQARAGSAMDQFARGGSAGGNEPWGIPAGFDASAFLAAAKGNYVKLQNAWDQGDLAELQEFTTNDMFIALTHELRARGGKSKTEVVDIDAELLGIESLPEEHIASVKFDGTLRVDGEIERVSEVWNLAKPVRGSGGWVLAGIQQLN
jgi:predicted lipid-binding transport protein (Tim44 family)